MFLLNWYREFLEIRHCESCEVLKMQLTIANEERKFLIDKLTAKEPVANTNQIVKEPVELKPLQTGRMPWNVRRQMLEAEDREKAKLIKKREEETKNDSSLPSKLLTINEIEKELGVNNG